MTTKELNEKLESEISSFGAFCVNYGSSPEYWGSAPDIPLEAIKEIIGELFNEVIGETEKFEEILTSTPRIVGQSNYVKDVRNTLRQQQRGLMGIALRDISELKENK